jgi:hypothetical protein
MCSLLEASDKFSLAVVCWLIITHFSLRTESVRLIGVADLLIGRMRTCNSFCVVFCIMCQDCFSEVLFVFHKSKNVSGYLKFVSEFVSNISLSFYVKEAILVRYLSIFAIVL